jgi:hypothetical protein
MSNGCVTLAIVRIATAIKEIHLRIGVDFF